ncbi:hypothetical protein MSG28_012690 [Choristoneura fumiferana]|uniref:Uncharacterized protein n=1 Tax=Choristoneura fumiferana TaxID=7141 RepID=A0ACC0JHP9_CHOFU|nr:hypothetical protein MSG28_012690 [Choristoneura fumiferana]
MEPILLLEAGPEEPDVTSVPALAPVLAASSIDWGYRTQPEELTCRAQRGHSCSWTRGKTMGGSSAVNYMVYMRGNKADYDGWAEQGNPGWSYSEVLPYFKKAENNRDIESLNKYYHAVGGPLNVERFPYVDNNELMMIQGYRELGLPVTDFNGENQYGTDLAQSTSLNGKRMSVNAAYIKPIRHKRPNLKIINEVYVTKLIINKITKTAMGVEYIKQGIPHTAYASKEVIVSSGPANTPKLLMLSGIGPREQLESLGIPVLVDLRVGYNLQDHVTTDALVLALSNKTSTLVDGPQLLNEIYDYYSQPPHKHGPLSSSVTLNAVAFIKTGLADDDLPDIQIHADGRNVEEFYSDPQTYIASNIFPLSFFNGIAFRPLLLVPKSKGFIMLNYTDPVFGPPLIFPRFFTEQIDVEKLVAGTCKMGPSWDSEAVVDARLRVYGIKKLRVIDSSIMPTILRSNLNAPTIMIAEKAADMIKEDWYYC